MRSPRHLSTASQGARRMRLIDRYPTRPVFERLMERAVCMPNGCLEWSGLRNKQGYGLIRVDGFKTSTHRIRWMCEHSSIPKGMLICHTCDNPPCFELSHLFLGTYSDNALDMVRKGRNVVRREGSGNALLTIEMVRRARSEYYERGWPIKTIASGLSVRYEVVRRMLRGETRSRVE